MLSRPAAFVARYAGRERSLFVRWLSLGLGGFVFLVLGPLLLGLAGHWTAGGIGLQVSRSLEWALGIAGLAVGLFFLAWSVLTFWFVGKGTPVPFTSPSRLVTTGPFRYTRNPIKLGAILFYFGVGTLFDQMVTGLAMLTVAAILGTLYHRLIEEKELLMRFGDEYEAYRRTTSFLLPMPPWKARRCFDHVLGQTRLDALPIRRLVFGEGFRQGWGRIWGKCLFHRLAVLMLLLLASLLRAFPPPPESQAFERAQWVVSVDVGKATYLFQAFPPPPKVEAPKVEQLPDGSTLQALPFNFDVTNDGSILEAQVREVLKAPVGARPPRRFSIYDNGFVSTATDNAQANRRMILFLVPAKPTDAIQAKYPKLMAEPRWEVLRAFAIDAEEPNGQDNEEGLRALVTMKGPRTAQGRLAAVKQILRSTRSTFGMWLALTELRELHTTRAREEIPGGDETSGPPDREWQRAIPRLLMEVGARWASDKREPIRRKRWIAVDLLAFANQLGATPDPCLVLQLMNEDGVPLMSGTVHLLDQASLEKALPRVRACVHGQEEDVAEAAMGKLAEFLPERLEEDLQADDIPPLRSVRGQEVLQSRGYAFRLPRRHLDLQEVEPLLRATVARTREGDLFLLRMDLESAFGRDRPPSEPWRRALRLLEPLLNDSVADRAALVAAAFRTHHIPLRLVEGKYLPDYAGKALPPLTLRVIPPGGAWLKDAPVKILEVDEVFPPEGQRVELPGTWLIGAMQEPHYSTWMSIPDPGVTPSQTGTRRSRLDLERLLKKPGLWKLTIGKRYDQDDRKDGGAWTGVVWAEAIPVQVE